MNPSSSMPRLGNYAIAALAGLNIVLWLIGLPANDGRSDFIRQIIAEMLSSTGMILMGCAIVLSLRLPVLEPFFGGLDRMYKSHKTAALTGLGLVILHFVLIPITGKSPLARDLGRIALAGFLILIALTLAPRLPVIGGYFQLAYHHWKYSHRLVGAFFILGMIHAFNAPTLLYTAEPAASYWRVCVYAAAAAYVYKQLLAPLLARGAGYVVASVRKLNPSTVEVALKPDGAHVRQRAGQFAFVRFPGEPGLGESHPFTVSSAPGEPHLRFTIKASGDWTKALHAGLREGAKARVQGAHGGFDFRTGGPRQIWVAGGIGVTPFLSWIRSLTDAPAQQIAFFYSVRAEPDAVFWDEFQAAAARFPSLIALRNVSSTDGSLTLDKIKAGCAFDVAGADVYLCGPPPMVLAFAAQFRAAGVPAGKIHYEEFNFR